MSWIQVSDKQGTLHRWEMNTENPRDVDNQWEQLLPVKVDKIHGISNYGLWTGIHCSNIVALFQAPPASSTFYRVNYKSVVTCSF